MAVASAGPCASLHLTPDRQPYKHPTTLFFTGWMPFLLPNQQHQSTEGMWYFPTRRKKFTCQTLLHELLVCISCWVVMLWNLCSIRCSHFFAWLVFYICFYVSLMAFTKEHCRITWSVLFLAVLLCVDCLMQSEQETAYYMNFCYSLKLFEMVLLQVRKRWPPIPFPQSFLKEWKGRNWKWIGVGRGKEKGEGREFGSRIFTLVNLVGVVIC